MDFDAFARLLDKRALEEWQREHRCPYCGAEMPGDESAAASDATAATSDAQRAEEGLRRIMDGIKIGRASCRERV